MTALRTIPAEAISALPPDPRRIPALANGSTEEFLAHDLTVLLQGWLTELRSLPLRSRRRMRMTNTLFMTDDAQNEAEWTDDDVTHGSVR
jgi:hypothetical protein